MTKKKIIRIVVIALIIIAILLLVWYLFIYPRVVFRENESKLAAAGERYYQINRSYLPSEKGRVVSVSLNTLVKQEYLDGLYTAYGKLCDLNESNVKVVNDGKDNKYYTYLKCGDMESDVDHEGPVITLKGKMEETVSRGSTYEDPGIESVVDDTDGKIDISKVTVKGEVNTANVGAYEITYTVADSLNNKTTVTRTVNVEERLSSIVKEATKDTNNYYKGYRDDNYIMFNNMLFRIVKINDNDTIMAVSEEPLASVDYTNNGRFANSSLDKWLNDYFYNLLEDKYKDLIVATKWCDDVVNKDNYMTTECTRTSAKRNIGIMSIQDYNNTLQDGNSFYDSRALMWFSNIGEDNNPWTLTSMYDYPLKTEPMNQEYLFNVRPTITLKKNTKVLSGNGSSGNPYILVENKTAKKNSNLNERQIGEYITYKGYTYRISNLNKNGTTEVIMTGVIKNGDNELNIGYNNGSGKKVYNSKQKGNIGYQIINDLTKYISTDLFEKTKVEVPIYSGRVTYQGKKNIKEYNDIISIPSTFDIFSAKGLNSSNNGYWLIDSSNEENIKTMVYPIGTVSYTPITDDTMAAVKVKAVFKKDVIITDGNGTLSDPYEVRD